jgi:hypothetical protein
MQMLNNSGDNPHPYVTHLLVMTGSVSLINSIHIFTCVYSLLLSQVVLVCSPPLKSAISIPGLRYRAHFHNQRKE